MFSGIKRADAENFRGRRFLKISLRRWIVSRLHHLIREGGAHGFQLALGYKDKSLGVFTAGFQSVENRIPINSSSWFDLSSLTKILGTIDLLMEAMQNRKIEHLDQPIGILLSPLNSKLRNRSLRQLLEHRAGLPPVFEALKDFPTSEEKMSYFLGSVDENYKGADESPQENYSDIGFMLLGVCLEFLYQKRLRDL